MIERMDHGLLARFDAFVAWSERRGGAGQWALARAATDMMMALGIGGALRGWASNGAEGGRGETIATFAALSCVLAASWWAQRRSIACYERLTDGRRLARSRETSPRRILLIMCLSMPILLVADAGAAAALATDALLAPALMMLTASSYLKSALPSPRSPDRETERRPAVT